MYNPIMISKSRVINIIDSIENDFPEIETRVHCLFDQLHPDVADIATSADMTGSKEAVEIIRCWLEKYRPERDEISVMEIAMYAELVVVQQMQKHLCSIFTFEQIAELTDSWMEEFMDYIQRLTNELQATT